MIKTENISKSYFDEKVEVPVLKNIFLNVKKGETVSIMGPSGAGKSTLLHILGLMDKPSSGKITVDGIENNANENSLADYRNGSVGFVFQFYNLLPEFSAIENVMMPALISGAEKSSAQKKAEELLDEVGLNTRTGHLPSELSGGEQQRVAIARALMNSPKVVIADEPTGNLDKQTGEKIIELIMKLQRKHNFTLIIATHNEDIANKFSRIIHIVDGQLIN